jgi:hypothetical protein
MAGVVKLRRSAGYAAVLRKRVGPDTPGEAARTKDFSSGTLAAILRHSVNTLEAVQQIFLSIHRVESHATLKFRTSKLLV